MERLLADGVDVDAAIQQGTYILWDVREALSTFMVDASLDPARLSKAVSDLIKQAAKGAMGEPRRVVACGECAPTLWGL